MQQGYHFPPPDAQPAYGYSNPQLLAPQQWPQHGAPQPYEVNYQAYGADPGALQRGGHAQHQGYNDTDDFGDGYYEDEEPRRGKRWLLIVAALVGAIGVGGALAYTYRSIVAPKSRLVATKTDAGVKVKVGSAERPPVTAADEPAPPPKVADPSAQEDPPPGAGDNQGPRSVKTIAIRPGSGAPAPVIPGITLYTPPDASAPSAKEQAKEVQPPPSRVKIGTPPPAPPPAEKAAKEEDDPPPVAPPPASKKGPVQAALVAPKAPPPSRSKETPSGSGLGFVAVIKSDKTLMDATKSLADLQQKYPEALGGDKSFDVQEADLSARNLGTMYRVVVGPPGSHNAAAAVCAQLKAAGYVGCWVKEF
jgi:hypothetical protein